MRSNLFLFSLATSFTLALSAQAARPIGETALRVNLVDAKSGERINDVFVAASETYYQSGYHSSSTICFRAASKKLQSPTDAVRLPAVNVVTSTQVVSDTRHIEFLAYRPGYCAAKPYATAESAGFIKWANKNDPNGLWGSVKSLKPGDVPTISMTPASDPSEHRLRHLVEVAKALGSTCRDLQTAHRDAIIPAILQEVSSIAMTPVERFLAAQITQMLLRNDDRKQLWTVYDQAAKTGDVPKLQQLIDWGRADPLFERPLNIPNGQMSMSPASNMLPLDRGFGINSRNERGFTPLMEAVSAMQIRTTQLLLENGADANMLSGPGGYSAIDLALARARIDVKETGTEGFEFQLLRIIDLLMAQRPALTVHPLYLEELTNIAAWNLTPHLDQFWKQVRERATKLTPRPKVTLVCPIELPIKGSLDLAPGVRR